MFVLHTNSKNALEGKRENGVHRKCGLKLKNAGTGMIKRLYHSPFKNTKCKTFNFNNYSNLFSLNIKQVYSPGPVAIDSALLFTCVKKQMALTYLLLGGKGGWQRVHASLVLCVFLVRASGILFALVLFCLSLLPFSLSLSALLSLQPASLQTGGQAMPLRSACYERWVTEPDNTTNCSIFEEIKHSVCLKFHYLFAFLPPPLINLALYAKQRSSSRVESNKLGLCESCKAAALLYSCTL